MVSQRAVISAPEVVPKESWELEFSLRHAIPSSTRIEPAKALLLFSEILHLGSPMKVLDAGSGNGRNTVYLAKRGCQVTAVDFAEFPLAETRRRVFEASVAGNVSIVRHSLVDPMPVPNETFDFVLDSYVSCHFLREETRLRLWGEMIRVTKNGGHFLSILFSKEDEYYSQLQSNKDPLVCDPANGIWKRLYSDDEAKSCFSRDCELQYFVKFEFPDVVLGKTYKRIVFVRVLKKTLL